MPPVTYAQLLENGWTRHAIQGAVARGSLRRVARGWYDVGGCSADELTAAAAGGRLGCLTGLRDQGVWVAPNTHPHIITPRWSEPRGSGVHHALPRGAMWSGSAITYGVVECLRQVLRYHDVETALIVLESACNLGLVSERTVAGLIAECSARRARHLAWFDPRSESGSETRVRLFLVRRGYKVRPQAVIPGVGRVDLLVGESLIIECDSHAHHTGETNYRGDRRRDLSATADDYRVVRLTWEQCFLTWPTTTSLLLTHLRTRRYLRPPSPRWCPAFSGDRDQAGFCAGQAFGSRSRCMRPMPVTSAANTAEEICHGFACSITAAAGREVAATTAHGPQPQTGVRPAPGPGTYVDRLAAPSTEATPTRTNQTSGAYVSPPPADVRPSQASGASTAATATRRRVADGTATATACGARRISVTW